MWNKRDKKKNKYEKNWITRDGIYCAVYLITWGIGLMWMFINGWAWVQQ